MLQYFFWEKPLLLQKIREERCFSLKKILGCNTCRWEQTIFVVKMFRGEKTFQCRNRL